MKYPFEPFKIMMVEPIKILSEKERIEILKRYDENVLKIPGKYITIDLLTDSGVNALSVNQYAKSLLSDISFSGNESYEKFKKKIKEIFGKKHVFAVHQGRASEKILSELFNKGDTVISNTFFLTTKANFEYRGIKCIDLPHKENKNFYSEYPFKGDIDVDELKEILKRESEKIKAVIFTLTNNLAGGHPVSLENVKEVKEILKDKLIIFDACRIFENAYLYKIRTKSNKSVKEIVKEYSKLADIIYMSTKKDAISLIGGFITFDDDKLVENIKKKVLLYEGILDHGGITGKDFEIITQGFDEGLDEIYLRYRVEQVAYLGERLNKIGVPVMKPYGGHMLYIDTKKFVNLEPIEFSKILYIKGGIRAAPVGELVEMGKRNYLRIAIPRRMYTQSHLDYVVEIFEKIRKEFG